MPIPTTRRMRHPGERLSDPLGQPPRRRGAARHRVFPGRACPGRRLPAAPELTSFRQQ